MSMLSSLPGATSPSSLPPPPFSLSPLLPSPPSPFASRSSFAGPNLTHEHALTPSSPAPPLRD
eukprot:3064375-Pleurochrysis_carterae.AAC.1